MKIYNRSPGRVIAYWNAEDKVGPDGKPLKPLTKYVLNPELPTPDIPAGLANDLLKNMKHRFTADVKALAAEQKIRKEREEALEKVKSLEGFVGHIKNLVLGAGGKNKLAAKAAADELDSLLSQFKPGAPIPGSTPPPAPVAPPDPTPTATSEATDEATPRRSAADEQAEFESPKK